MIVSLETSGNYSVIRLPTSIINQLKVKDKLELEIENNELVLKPIHYKARKGWAKAFATMHQTGEDNETNLVWETFLHGLYGFTDDFMDEGRQQHTE